MEQSQPHEEPYVVWRNRTGKREYFYNFLREEGHSANALIRESVGQTGAITASFLVAPRIITNSRYNFNFVDDQWVKVSYSKENIAYNKRLFSSDINKTVLVEKLLNKVRDDIIRFYELTISQIDRGKSKYKKLEQSQIKKYLEEELKKEDPVRFLLPTKHQASYTYIDG